jgi:predicted component of type VI protein secretion system
MSRSETGFDYDRYRKLLAEAIDEPKRLAFINVLIEEKAKDRLAGESPRTGLTELELKPKPKAEFPTRDLSALANDFLRKRIAQADRPVEHEPVRR